MIDVRLWILSTSLFVHGCLGSYLAFKTNGSTGRAAIDTGVRKISKTEKKGNPSAFSYLDGRPIFPPPKPLKGNGVPKGSRTSGEYKEEEDGEFKRVGELDRVCGRRDLGTDPTGFNEDLGFIVFQCNGIEMDRRISEMIGNCVTRRGRKNNLTTRPSHESKNRDHSTTNPFFSKR